MDSDDERFVAACKQGDAGAARALLPCFATDPDLLAVVDRWSSLDELVPFLVERAHVLHTFDVVPLSRWVEHHLWEADPRNLVDAGSEDARGRTPAQVARESGHAAIAAMCEEREDRPVPKAHWSRPYNRPEQEAFLAAAASGDVATLRTLFDADPTVVATRTKWGMPGSYQVGTQGSDDAAANDAVIDLLLEAGDPDPYQGLCGACWWGADGVVRTWLDRGIPAEDPARRSAALPFAAMATRFNEMSDPESFPFIVDALLTAGADPGRADRFGWTPFGMAQGPVREQLVAAGAAAVEVDPAAAEIRKAIGLRDVAELVAQGRADPERLRFRDREGCLSALLAACYAGHPDAAAALADLLPYGPDVDEAAALGDPGVLREALDRTIGAPSGPWIQANPPPSAPLHHAAWFGHLEAVELLLAAGYPAVGMHRPDVAGDHHGPEPTHRDRAEQLVLPWQRDAAAPRAG